MGLFVLAGVVVVLLLPMLAAVWWTRQTARHADPDQRLELSQLIGVSYAGLGVSVVVLWLGAVALGLSLWTSLAMPLTGAALLTLAARRRTRHTENGRPMGDPPPRTVPRPARGPARRPALVLGALSLMSVTVVAIPFAPYGWERADGVHRMAMTDWEKHLVMTTGVAASEAFPPPHPYVRADPTPSYYFGYHLVAAAIFKAGGGVGDVYHVLLLLTLLTAASTPFVVYTFARGLCDVPTALTAAAGATLLIGFDLVVVVLDGLQALIQAWPVPLTFEGLRAVVPTTHIDSWLHNVDRQFSAPVITTMWAPHQTAAALIALITMFLLAPHPRQADRARAGWLLPALLVASLPALSAYMAIGLAAGVALAIVLASVQGRCMPWHTGVFTRWARPGLVGVLLSAPVMPTLLAGSSSGLIVQVSSAGSWSNGALWSWLFGDHWWTRLLDTPAVYLVDYGIIGVLCTLALVGLRRQQRMGDLERESLAVIGAILVVVTFVRPPVDIGNNLYARAPLLAWFAAAPFAALQASSLRRPRWMLAAVIVCAMGTGYAVVAYVLEGTVFWAVSTDRVEALRWTNDQTDPGAVVAMPPPSYRGAGYWLRRPMVLGERRLAELFGAEPALVNAAEASLEAAYAAPTPTEASSRFDALEADVIYVRRGDGDPPWARAPCFDVRFRNRSWLVLVRTRPACAQPP